MNILLIKRVFRTVNGVNQAITCKNQVCTIGSCDTLFFSYWQAEQILYRNIWSEMKILHIKRRCELAGIYCQAGILLTNASSQY